MAGKTGSTLRARLQLECLEGRIVPAGNVTVQVLQGDLVVRGDDAANSVVITQGFGLGQLIVLGLNRGGSNTTINGVPPIANISTVLVNGVTDDFDIRLGGGSDKLFMRTVTVPDDLTISMGAGDDKVVLRAAQVVGDTQLSTGNGNDIVEIKRASVFQQKFEASLGGGNDSFAVQLSGFFNDARMDGLFGFDTFVDQGGNSFFHGVNIANFEFISPIISRLGQAVI